MYLAKGFEADLLDSSKMNTVQRFFAEDKRLLLDTSMCQTDRNVFVQVSFMLELEERALGQLVRKWRRVDDYYMWKDRGRLLNYNWGFGLCSEYDEVKC